MAKHTPGTLEVDKRGRHESSAGDDPKHYVLLGGPEDKPQDIADTLNCDYMLTLEEQKANLDRLAHCWNCHDDLVEALTRLVERCVADIVSDGWSEEQARSWPEVRQALKAIAKATGGTDEQD